MTFKVPNHTQTPNELFDALMKDMDLSELKVVLAICRKTFGWHKQLDRISLSQLEKITGMSRTSVIKGIQEGIGRGVIERFACDDGFEYGLVIDATSTEYVPEASTESVHTKKTIKKKHTSRDFISASIGKKNPLAKFPVDVKEKLEILFKHFKHLKVSNKADWIKQTREHLNFSLGDIEKMCKYAKKNDWKVARPRSIVSAYNMMNQKEVDEYAAAGKEFV